MNVQPTPLSGLFEIRSERVADERGHFSRVFCDGDLATIRPGLHVRQANLSFTARRGSVRGMHFQVAPAAEVKIVRCLRGRVFDVAVDLRAGSVTLGQWHGRELSADDDLAIFIPEGFAHGFQALEDDVELLYFHTAPWSAAHEGGVRHDDPRLAIRWPLPVSQVSTKDRAHPLLGGNFPGLPA